MRAVVVSRAGGPEVLELPEAHRYMEANKARGKLVVVL